MIINSHIEYYLELFKGLRDKINYLMYNDNINKLKEIENYNDEDIRAFSLMVMVSLDEGKTFKWLLLNDQKEKILKLLKKESSEILTKIDISAENFLETWINFHFGQSGLIKYFIQTKKNTEFIKDFSLEANLISAGYENDYIRQEKYKKLLENYRSKLNNKEFDPFKTLEGLWGFKNVAFYYIKLPKLKEIQFVAIFPVLVKDHKVFFENADFIFSLVKNATLGANLMKDIIDVNIKELYKQTLKTAISSILIDSYAHNISAHSLAALKWWFEQRYRMMDKRFYVSEDKGLKLENLLPSCIEVDQKFIKDTSEKYYEILGLTDSKYNKEFFSLFDYLQFGTFNKECSDSCETKLLDITDKIFSFNKSDDELCKDPSKGIVSPISKKDKEDKSLTINAFFPRFPVPIDYALYPFFRFLRDKGAFWSGVTRDTAYGGESKSWYQILWEDFANNPLYLGTIAKSEKISKLNINLAVKTDDGWIKGKFVTIDMSIIDEDEKNIQVNDSSLKEEGEIKKEDCNFNTNCSLDYSKYSKYAFVKLGGCFKSFREELSKDKYNVFLPGGLIGEHALFTIFENTIRNIKHYKDDKQLKEIRKNGIDFWISIDDEKLSSNNNTDKKPELFKLSVWLEHKTDLLKLDEENKLKECLWKKVTDSTLQPILDDNGSPRMGGNSQDKACAAMLFTNKFISVESEEGKRKNNYYPWIHFTTNINKEHYNSDYDLPKTKTENLKYYSANEEEAKKIIDEYVISLDENYEGYLKKYFYLWKSEDYLLINETKDLTGENVSRFKFVILSDKVRKEERKELINQIRENGIIRLLYNKNNGDSFSSESLIKKLKEEIPEKFNDETNQTIRNVNNNNERLKVLYNIWLKDWLKYDKDFSVGFKKDQNIFLIISLPGNDNNPIKSYHKNNNNISGEKINKVKENILIKLSHGGNDENNSCNVRSHGYFWGKYFVNAPYKAPEDLGDSGVYDKQKDYLLMDLLEVIATRIIIFDNRINLRMNGLHKTKRKEVFENFLKLFVYEEEIENEKDKSAYFNSKLEMLNNNNNSKEPLILIIHLSYIEAMDYTEENINVFIENHLKALFEKENFIFVLTSGRGRDAWKKKLDLKYRKQTIFKPVESLISAVESGLSYNDNFDVKHNLIKVIFGS